MNNFHEFFNGKRVLLTGHTGFKGAWMALWLHEMGANVIGYALDPEYEDSLSEKTKLSEKIIDIRGDVRDLEKLEGVFKEHKPEIVIHMAAQAILRRSYDTPRDNFETNIMGTVNILECARTFGVKSTVVVTSDKCYKNKEQGHGYVETDEMSDKDPYSCSKGCKELIVQSYRTSFGVKVATGRAGNVLGGGDWGEDRLVPDIFRALKEGKDIVVRNPESIRPWQFVLDPLSGYLLLAKKLYEGEDVNAGWNFGPDEASVSVNALTSKIVELFGSGNVVVEPKDDQKPEAGLLMLNCDKAKAIGWKALLDIDTMVKYVVEGYKSYSSDTVYETCIDQIKRYEQLLQ